MKTYPHTVKNATFIGDVIEYTYSLDDQVPQKVEHLISSSLQGNVINPSGLQSISYTFGYIIFVFFSGFSFKDLPLK
jgi:hypothetical protein